MEKFQEISANTSTGTMKVPTGPVLIAQCGFVCALTAMNISFKFMALNQMMIHKGCFPSRRNAPCSLLPVK